MGECISTRRVIFVCVLSLLVATDSGLSGTCPCGLDIQLNESEGIQWREELREHDAYIASLGCSLPLIRRFSKAFGQGNETVSSILQSLDRERNDNLAVESTNVWMSSETCMDHEASNTHAVC